MNPLARRFAVLGVVLAAALVAAVAVWPAGGSSPSGSGVAVGVTTGTAPAGPEVVAAPERHLGPQGRVGQFVVHCAYSHSGPNDPIVHKGMTGMSHRHDFYGAVGTNASSTPRRLRREDTTCNKKVDTAAYWQPALYDGDKVVRPLDMHAYYRAAPGVAPKAVRTMPQGLALIAGNQFATGPQPGEATGWTCGIRSDLSDTPPECPASAPLHLVLTFQDCWDGRHLDSADHSSHAAYSKHGRCPEAQPVHIPQIALSIRFPISGPNHDLRLASGDVYTAHGDFLNAWDPAGLKREVTACIHRDVVCDLGSNREEETLFRETY